MQTNRQSLDTTSGYRQLPSTDSSEQSSNGCISYFSDSSVVNNSSTIDGKAMNESKYSKVIFSEISESYATDADIECRFYVGDAVKPANEDKICLFKLGWTDPLETEVAKKVSDCLTDNEFGERKVMFDASELPKNTEEFFQFCYLTANDDICGASTPFRFVRPHDEDLIQLVNDRNSDEEDFVVVRSQQALLQERLQQLVNENGVLEYSKRSLEQLIGSKSNEVLELRRMYVESEDKSKLSQLEVNRVMDKLKTSEEENRSNAEKVEALELEVAELKKMRNDCETRLESTQNEMIRLSEVVKELETNGKIADQMVKSREQEVVSLIKKTADQQILIDELISSKAMVEAKLEYNNTSIAKVMSERRDLDSENRMLRNELEDMKAKCDTLQSKTEIMMSEILDFDKIKLKSKVQIKTMNEELESMKTQMNEAEDTQKQMSIDWKRKEEMFEKQIEEMRLRLSNAAQEYQKLFRYNTKLETKIDKIKAKVKKYFETKSQTKSASNVSQSERQELMARAETEVKSLIDSDIAPDTNQLSAMGAAAAEESTDRMDSIQINPMPCIICNEEITCISRDSKPMIQHLEEKHSQRLCPVCSTPFDLTLPGHSNYFQMHVDNHFDGGYPNPNPRHPMNP